MENLLKITDLSKSYKKAEFNLSDISFTIKPKEVVGLIGKNGCGKSTLINTIVGNRSKDSGEILFFDHSISPKDYDHKEHLGVVFDDLRVPNKLTINDIDKVFKNIYQHWDSEYFSQIVERFDLPQNRQVKKFSRGMRMKTALAIAMSHQSKLLILDEATAGMDVSAREQVVEILQEHVDRGNGVLMSSHISDDVDQLVTKLIFMKDGRILFTEEKDYLLKHYGIVEQPKDEFDVPDHLIIASRIHKNVRKALVFDRSQVAEAQPLQRVDDATKIIMRGDR